MYSFIIIFLIKKQQLILKINILPKHLTVYFLKKEFRGI